MKVTLITPTGNRPEAFALCEKWIFNQTYKGLIEWIVTDDFQEAPTRFTLGQIAVKAPKLWTPEINTQRYNLDALMQRITGDYIFVIEDDEYYAPNYIEEMLKLLEHSDIAGLSNSKYYHLRIPGFKYMDNFTHASLCQTAFKKSVLPLLYRAVHSGHYYFDIKLWEYALADKLKSTLVSNTNWSIGIKGMPGRAGLGAGHARVGYRGDNDHKIFQEWVGQDWVYYQKYLK